MNKHRISRRITAITLSVIIAISLSIPTYAGIISNQYKEALYSVLRLNPNENAWSKNYQGIPFPGLITIATIEANVDLAKPLIEEYKASPELKAALESMKGNPAETKRRLNNALHGAGNALADNVNGTFNRIKDITVNTVENDSSYYNLDYEVAKRNSGDPDYNLLKYAYDYRHSSFSASVPGEYAAAHFSENTSTDTGVRNRYSSALSEPQYNDPKATYTGKIAFSPSSMKYNTDGTFELALTVINQTGNDIVLSGFDKLQIIDQNDKIILDTQKVATDNPIVIFSKEIQQEENGTASYGGRIIYITAEAGTYNPDADLRNTVGKVYAAPIYEEITFQDKGGNTVTDPSHNTDALVSYTTASGETHML